jgi:hypothetical protein
MLHQIGRKLRQQIHQFSGKLCAELGKVSTRFVEEMVYGMCASGSVLLSRIARVLEESIELHATHKRLSANLDHRRLESTIAQAVLNQGAKRIQEDTLLIVDPSDITKKYAKKMEYLAEVRDGSEKKLGNGYWLCEVVGCETGEHDITPLAQILWSQESPEFVSENDEVLSLVEHVLEATEHKGIVVYDRGGDRREFLTPWTSDPRIRYLVRQRGDRHLLYKGRRKSGMELARTCKTPYAETIVKHKAGEERAFFLEFGFVPVRLPECPERPLFLVVVKGFGEKPLLLLTTEPMRRHRAILWWAVEAYLTRWRVEDTIRFIKQSYDLENVRVLTYRRLKNLVTLLLAVAYFTAVRVGMKARLKIMAVHVLDAAKRLFGIPDFRYYALADGMKEILHKAAKGTLHPRGEDDPPDPQLALFDS